MLRAARPGRSPLGIAAAVLVAALAGGCLQNVSTGQGTGDTSAGGSSASTGATGGGTGQGTSCGQDRATGVVLCLGIDLCPGLTIDSEMLPGCGFRAHGTPVLDLECVCGDELCAIGVPDTCAQATALLSSATALSVCQQVPDGRCVNFAGDAGPASSSGASPAASGACDRTCEAECGGSPSCIQLCGC